MKSNLMTLRQLDREVEPLKQLAAFRHSWVKLIRKAFGMTTKQLAKRLGVHSSRVVKIESSEVDGAVTLRTLQNIAEALDCKLVYGFVPNSSFENTVRQQARKIALQQIKRTAHTMALESQSTSKKWLDMQVKDLTEELLQKSWKYLWEK